jgi:hypothetical protein
MCIGKIRLENKNKNEKSKTNIVLTELGFLWIYEQHVSGAYLKVRTPGKDGVVEMINEDMPKFTLIEGYKN